MLVARREDRLRALADEVRGEHEVCDVSDREAVDAVAARVRERHPQVKLLVNNAGVAARADFLTGEPERIERVIADELPRVGLVPARVPAALEAARPPTS